MEKRPYEKLIAWQEAFSLCLWIYTLTKKFPSEEKFGLTSQMRRAVVSISLNIAEGNSRRSSKDKMYFFEIALGSLEEVHCQCQIALGLAIIDEREMEKANSKINRTSYLISKLRSSFA